MAVNAKAVIDIDVNDRAFKQFQESFERFQKALAKTPAAWAGMTKENKASMEAFNRMTAALMAQQNVTRQIAAAQRDVAVHSSHTERLWKKTVHHASQFYHFIKGATLDILKWAGITGMIGGLVSSIGTLFGLTQLASGVRRDRREAAAVGLSIGEMSAMKHGFGHLINVPGITQGIATGMSDRRSEQRRMLTALHINPRGKTEMDVNREFLQKVYAEASKPGAHLGEVVRRFRLGSAGMDQGDLRALIKGGPAEFAKNFGVVGPAGVKGFDIKDESARKWSDFMGALEKAGDKIKAVLIDGLAPLMPELEKLTTRVADWIKTFFDSGGFKAMVEQLGTWIGDLANYFDPAKGSFRQDLETFKTYVGEFVTGLGKVVSAMQSMGLLPMGENDPRNRDASVRRTQKQIQAEGKTPSQKLGEIISNWWRGKQATPTEVEQENREREGYEGRPSGRRGGGRSRRGTTASQRMGFGNTGGVGGGYGGGGGGGSGGGGGGDNTDYSKVAPSKFSGDWGEDIKQLMGYGWSREQALGIVANLQAESGGKVNIWGDKGAAFGLAQWHPDRRANFKKVFGYDMTDKDVPEAKKRRDMIAFVNWELNNTEKAAGNKLKQETTPGGAGASFALHYERMADKVNEPRKRAGAANAMDVRYRNEVVVNNNTGGNAVVSVAGAAGR